METKNELEIEEYKPLELSIEVVEVGECERPGCVEQIKVPRSVAEKEGFEKPDRCGACGIIENKIEMMNKARSRKAKEKKEEAKEESEDQKKAASGDKD